MQVVLSGAFRGKVGYVCSNSGPGPLYYLGAAPDSCFCFLWNIWAWVFKLGEAFRMVLHEFSLQPVCSISCYMHVRSRLGVWSMELSSVGVNAALFLWSLNTAAVCLSLQGSQWTKPGHKHINWSLWEDRLPHKDAIHADLLLPSCGRTIHSHTLSHTDRCAQKHTQDTLSANLLHSLSSVYSNWGNPLLLCTWCLLQATADVFKCLCWTVKLQKEIWQQNLPWNMRDFRD